MSESDGTSQTTSVAFESLDYLYDVLSDTNRRQVVAHLGAADEPVTLEDLSAAIVARSEGGRAESSDDLDNAKLRLHHCHLPKLDDEGVLEYDTTNQTVRSSEHPVYSKVGELPGFDSI